jgi:hypothetical protein
LTGVPRRKYQPARVPIPVRGLSQIITPPGWKYDVPAAPCLKLCPAIPSSGKPAISMPSPCDMARLAHSSIRLLQTNASQQARERFKGRGADIVGRVSWLAAVAPEAGALESELTRPRATARNAGTAPAGRVGHLAEHERSADAPEYSTKRTGGQAWRGPP